MKISPITLIGEHVRLEPLRIDHLPGLCRVGMDEEIWRWTANVVESESDLERYVRDALASQAAGNAIPFVTVESSTGALVGSTRFGNIDVQNRKVEIGWTWIAPEWQRTRINTEAKLLMFEHAFETWKCIRVELKTDANNRQSREAILRIGAVEEGTLRNHMITESGRYRDTVYFSVIESEWESVKSDLQYRLRS